MENSQTTKIDQSGYTLTPAYGRDYRDKSAVLKDFLDGKDFYVHMPQRAVLCSVRDFKPGTSVILRYANRTKVVEAFVPELT